MIVKKGKKTLMDIKAVIFSKYIGVIEMPFNQKFYFKEFTQSKQNP